MIGIIESFKDVVMKEEKVEGSAVIIQEVKWGKDLALNLIKSLTAGGTVNLFNSAGLLPGLYHELNKIFKKTRRNENFELFIIPEDFPASYAVKNPEVDNFTGDESKILLGAYLYLLKDPINDYLSELNSEVKSRISTTVYTILTKKYIVSSKFSNVQKQDQRNKGPNTKDNRSFARVASNENNEMSKSRQPPTLSLNIPSSTSMSSISGMASPSNVIFPNSVSDRSSANSPMEISKPQLSSASTEDYVKSLLSIVYGKNGKDNKRYYMTVSYKDDGTPYSENIEGNIPKNGYDICRIHSGSGYGSFEKLSPEESRKYSGRVYAFFTHDRTCHDLCHTRSKIPVHTNEKKIIENFIEYIKTILVEFNKDCGPAQSLFTDLIHEYGSLTDVRRAIGAIYKSYYELILSDKYEMDILKLLNNNQFRKNRVMAEGRRKEYEDKESSSFKTPDLVEGKMVSSLLGLEKEVISIFEMGKIKLFCCKVSNIIKHTNTFDADDIELRESVFQSLFGKTVYSIKNPYDFTMRLISDIEQLTVEDSHAIKDIFENYLNHNPLNDQEENMEYIKEIPITDDTNNVFVSSFLSGNDEYALETIDFLKLLLVPIESAKEIAEIVQVKNEIQIFQEMSLESTYVEAIVDSLISEQVPLGKSLFIGLKVTVTSDRKVLYSTSTGVYADNENKLTELLKFDTRKMIGKSRHIIMEIRNVRYDPTEELKEPEDRIISYEATCYNVGEFFLKKHSYSQTLNVTFDDDNEVVIFLRPYNVCVEIGAFMLSKNADLITSFENSEDLLSFDSELRLRYDEGVVNSAIRSTDNYLSSLENRTQLFDYDFQNEDDETVYKYKAFSVYAKNINTYMSSLPLDTEERVYYLNTKYFPITKHTLDMIFNKEDNIEKISSLYSISPTQQSFDKDQDTDPKKKASKYLVLRSEFNESDVVCAKISVFLSQSLLIRNNEILSYDKNCFDRTNYLTKKTNGILQAFEPKILNDELFYGCSHMVQLMSNLKEIDRIFINSKKNMIKKSGDVISKGIFSGILQEGNILDLKHLTDLSMIKALELLKIKQRVVKKLKALSFVSKEFSKRESSSEMKDTFYKHAESITFLALNPSFSDSYEFMDKIPNAEIPFNAFNIRKMNSYTLFDTDRDTADIATRAPTYVPALIENNKDNKHIMDIFSLFNPRNGLLEISSLCPNFSDLLKKVFEGKVKMSAIGYSTPAELEAAADHYREMNTYEKYYTPENHFYVADYICMFKILLTIVDTLNNTLETELDLSIEDSYVQMLISHDFNVSNKALDLFNEANDLGRNKTPFHAKKALPELFDLTLVKCCKFFDSYKMNELNGENTNDNTTIGVILKKIFVKFNFKLPTIIYNLRTDYRTFLEDEISRLSLRKYTLKKVEVKAEVKDETKSKSKTRRVVSAFDDEEEEVEPVKTKTVVPEEKPEEDNNDFYNPEREDNTYSVNGVLHILTYRDVTLPAMNVAGAELESFYENYEKHIAKIIQMIEFIPTSYAEFDYENLSLPNLSSRNNLFSLFYVENKRISLNTLKVMSTSLSYYTMENYPDAIRSFYYTGYTKDKYSKYVISRTVDDNFTSVCGAANISTLFEKMRFIETTKLSLQKLREKLLDAESKKQKIQTTIEYKIKDLEPKSELVISRFILSSSVISIILEAYREARIDDYSFIERIRELDKLYKKFIDRIQVLDMYSIHVFMELNKKSNLIYMLRKEMYSLFKDKEIFSSSMNTYSDMLADLLEDITLDSPIEDEVERLKTELLSKEEYSFIKPDYSVEQNHKLAEVELKTERIESITKTNSINCYFFIADHLKFLEKNFESISKASKTHKLTNVEIDFKYYRKANHEKLYNILNTDSSEEMFDEIYVNGSTKKKFANMVSNIEIFVRDVMDCLFIIDSGPGIHFIIEMILLTEQIINSTDSELLEDLVSTLREKFRRLKRFVSLENILNSSDFGKLVSIINGTMENFKVDDPDFRPITKIFIGKQNDEVTEIKVSKLFTFFISLRNDDSPNVIKANAKNLLNFMDISNFNMVAESFSTILDEYILPMRVGNGTAMTVINDDIILRLKERTFNVVENGITIKKKYNLVTRGNFLVKYVTKINKVLQGIIASGIKQSNKMTIRCFGEYVKNMSEGFSSNKEIEKQIMPRIIYLSYN